MKDRRQERRRRERELRRRLMRRELEPLTPPLIDDDGMHVLLPGTPPDQPTLDRLTAHYQQQIRNSPLWDDMVREFGPEKAEALLREFRAELR